MKKLFKRRYPQVQLFSKAKVQHSKYWNIGRHGLETTFIYCLLYRTPFFAMKYISTIVQLKRSNFTEKNLFMTVVHTVIFNDTGNFVHVQRVPYPWTWYRLAYDIWIWINLEIYFHVWVKKLGLQSVNTIRQ